MAIPAGVTTAVVHMDAPVSFIGDPGRLHVTITPSHSLVWTATGTPLGNFVDTISLDPGEELQIPLPHTDQPGFEDGLGNAFSGWYYTVRVKYDKDGQIVHFAERDFQILAGQASVDLALVPAGEAAVPEVAPILPVTSIGGLTGEVTMAELGLDQVDNTSDADKPVSILAQAALNGKANTAHTHAIGDTTGLQGALDLKLNAAQAVINGADTTIAPVAAGSYGVNLVDTAENEGISSHVDHYGAGIGFDIRNRPDAGMAMMVHQYSNSTAVRLDNTGTGPMLVIAQTFNNVLNPNSAVDTNAAGDAFRQVDRLGNVWAKLDGRGAISLTPPTDQTTETLRIIGNATSTKNSARITHNAGSHGVLIEGGAGTAGFFPLLVTGQNYAASVNTATDGGQVLNVTKNGTGAGEGLRVVNKGTGASVQINQNTTPVSRINADGEFEHLTAGKGVLLRSPDGTRYRLSVANGGTVSVVAAP